MIAAATGSGEVEVVEGEVQCVMAGREDIGERVNVELVELLCRGGRNRLMLVVEDQSSFQ